MATLEEKKILVINTGSTSTKFSLFVGDEEVFKGDVDHDIDALKACKSTDEQVALRKRTIDESLKENNVDLSGLTAVAARGGTFGNVKGGAYIVNDELIYACKHPVIEHASCLSALVGNDYAKEYGCEAYIYDAVCTDEVDDIARVTGIKGVERNVYSHTLNTRAVARAVADKYGKEYKDLNFVVVHMGGGDSINVHQHGRIVDIISDDEGPMSPERSGAISAINCAELCFSGEYPDYKSFMRKIHGNSGLVDYLGTKDMREIERRLEAGDEEAKKAIDAMVYQTAKAVASMAAVVDGKVDYIILTGGCMHRKWLAEATKAKVEWIAPVEVIPGAYEMQALAKGISRVLDGKEEARVYKLSEDKTR